jgi:hypothetical protein
MDIQSLNVRNRSAQFGSSGRKQKEICMWTFYRPIPNGGYYEICQSNGKASFQNAEGTKDFIRVSQRRNDHVPDAFEYVQAKAD